MHLRLRLFVPHESDQGRYSESRDFRCSIKVRERSYVHVSLEVPRVCSINLPPHMRKNAVMTNVARNVMNQNMKNWLAVAAKPVIQYKMMSKQVTYKESVIDQDVLLPKARYVPESIGWVHRL